MQRLLCILLCCYSVVFINGVDYIRDYDYGHRWRLKKHVDSKIDAYIDMVVEPGQGTYYDIYSNGQYLDRVELFKDALSNLNRLPSKNTWSASQSQIIRLVSEKNKRSKSAA